MLRRIHPWSSLFKLDMDVWACLIHCQHFHRCIDWLMKHKKIKWFFFPPEWFPFLYIFFDSSNQKHGAPPLQLMYSWYYVKMQGSCERLCSCCEGSGRRSRSSCSCYICLTLEIQKKLWTNAKDCTFGLLNFECCKNTLFTEFAQSLPRMSAVKQSLLYFSSCNTGILEAFLFLLRLQE